MSGAATSSVLRAAIGTVVANGVAAAVAFGAPLTGAQQTALLAFAGAVTTLVFAIYALVHVHTVSQAVTLAVTAPPQTRTAPTSSAAEVSAP